MSATDAELIAEFKDRVEMANKIKELESKLAIAVEELEWYADERNCDNPDFAHVEIDDGEEIADGGYRARKALAKIRDQK